MIPGTKPITEQQAETLSELFGSPDFKLSMADVLQSVTRRKVATIEELTSAEAKDVINVFKKFTKRSKK